MARSLNKVTLIGNLTRDPELRYTPQGTAVCSFGVATNRQWSTETGEKKEDVEFHNVVAWNKLAEICSQILSKGRKVYVEGRLQTNTWTGDDDVKRSRTEVVINEMIALDSRGGGYDDAGGDDFDIPESEVEESSNEVENQEQAKKAKTKPKSKNKNQVEEEGEDIPF
jgi:single-strand DNA-binding protein